jgi:predicted  nucleic acid-binding Zn-ribbon protein
MLSPLSRVISMNLVRVLPATMLSAVVLTACNTEAKQQLATVAHADSVHTDSLANVRRELMQEVMASTQFVSDINKELGKARALSGKQEPTLETTAEMTATNEQRKAIVDRISHLVARLDSVQNRLASTRRRVSQLTKDDSTLVAQVATYEKSIADLQAQAAKERADFQTVIDRQNGQIAELTSRVDTLNTVRTALSDTVTQLTSEKNTAYYIVGTKDELIKKGILVAEGGKRFFLLGGRNVVPARQLDPSNFSKIDRLADRNIRLPEGEYQILTRQNVSFAKPQVEKDGKIAGGLTIEQPEQFWSASRFLIIVRS